MWYKTMQDSGIESPDMMSEERKPPWGSDICVGPVGPEGASMQRSRERVFQPERTPYGKALRLKQPIECEGRKREKEENREAVGGELVPLCRDDSTPWTIW